MRFEAEEGLELAPECVAVDEISRIGGEDQIFAANRDAVRFAVVPVTHDERNNFIWLRF